MQTGVHTLARERPHEYPVVEATPLEECLLFSTYRSLFVIKFFQFELELTQIDKFVFSLPFLTKEALLSLLLFSATSYSLAELRLEVFHLSPVNQTKTDTRQMQLGQSTSLIPSPVRIGANTNGRTRQKSSFFLYLTLSLSRFKRVDLSAFPVTCNEHGETYR